MVSSACLGSDGLDTQGGTPNATGLFIYLVVAGGWRIDWSGRTTVVQAEAIAAIDCATPHRVCETDTRGQGRVIRVHTLLTGPVARLFLEEFGEPRVLGAPRDEPALRFAMSLINAELDAPRCGQPALLHRAADVLFVGLLRHLVAHAEGRHAGLFMGLADARVAKALVAMHRQPGFEWSLQRLADEAGMSRTAFSSTFRDTMNRTPGKYLTALRLALAQRAVDSGKGLKEVARAVGYANVSALSRALSRARHALEPVSAPGAFSPRS